MARDKGQATFDQQSYENKEDRTAQLYASALGNEIAVDEGYTPYLVNVAKEFYQ